MRPIIPAHRSPARVAAKVLLGLILAMLALTAGRVRAEELRAIASLDPSAIETGETAQLRIQITGATNATPVEVKVDGLNIQYVGHQGGQQIGIVNGNFSITTSDTLVYQLTPKRAGTFTIPALTVMVNGRTVRTQPIGLRVENGTPRPGQGGASSSTLDTEAHAEIVPDKATVYVGEAVPINLRLQLDSRINWEFEGQPTLDGEGFTKTKPVGQRPGQEQRDGRQYDVGLFRSVITPSRAGTLQIGPADFLYRAQAPRAQRARPRNPFADGFMEDFFNEARGFGPVREYKAHAEPATLTVKPLPTAGQPASFSGAVGKFEMTLEGGAGRVKMGDPLTLRVVISGAGNFDRVGTPVLKDPAGWRTYPPTPSFRQDDDLGLRATKTYELAVIPEAKHNHLPVFEFSYFDPETARYVTLQTKATPLVVEGEPPAATPPPARPAPAAGKTAAATPAPAATDILGLRYDLGSAQASRPLYRNRAFYLAQLAPLALLLGFVLVRVGRTRPEARPAARWRKEREALLAQLRRERSRQPFIDTATRVLQLQGAIRSGQPPEAVDGPALQRFYPGETFIEEIFEARAAVLFAGEADTPSDFSTAERERWLKAIADLAHR